MAKKKSLKAALFTAILSLIVCISMFAGTTFAWFTDSVTSSGNRVISGTLDVAFEMYDEKSGWIDVESNDVKIFDYDNWEPGYTQIVNLRVVNKGSLALKWMAKITTEKGLSELADVINVYVKSDDTNDTVRAAIESIGARPNESLDNYLEPDFHKFTLRYFIENFSEMTQGVLKEKDDAAYLGLVLQLNPEAGNAYQGLDLCGKFDINIIATQLAYEEDSFGNDYDKDAPLYLLVSDDNTLDQSFRDGGVVIMTSNIETLRQNAYADTVLDMNGKTLINNSTTGIVLWALEGNSLTVTGNGKIIDNSDIYQSSNVCLGANGEGSLLTVENGYFDAGSNDKRNVAVWSESNSKIIINGGSFVDGVDDDNGKSGLIHAQSGGSIEIYGGFFSSAYSSNLLDVSGNGHANSSITVFGGTYVNYNPAEETSSYIKIADGYTVISETKDNGDIWYTVIPKVSINNVKYDSIADAIEAAKDGDTINLSAGTFYEALNLQGKSLTIQGSGVDSTIIAGPQTYTTDNIPKQTWSGWDSNQTDSNVYALISANKDVTLNDFTVSANPEQIAQVGVFRWETIYAFVGIHVQSANATIRNVNIQDIKPATVIGNDHHNFALYITSAIGDANTYTATYTNGLVSKVNRGGIYCWSGNYSLKFSNVTVIGPGNSANPNGSLTAAEEAKNNTAIYAFAPFYVCSPNTYENVTIKDSWCVSGWGGTSWAWAYSWNPTNNTPNGITYNNCGIA